LIRRPTVRATLGVLLGLLVGSSGCGLSSGADWGPRLSPDERAMWFMSWRFPSIGESDLWTASRADLG